MAYVLRSYQEKGVAFQGDRPAILLRMDRGLGKTPTVLVNIDALILDGKVRKCLYVAPLSTLENVEREARRFGTVLSPVVVYGSRAERERLLRGRGNLFIINFAGVRIMGLELLAQNYDMMVVDESYQIKDSTSQISQMTKTLGRKAAYRRLLTGMLFAESIEDAWNQIDFLDPTVFPKGFYPFRARYCKMEKREIERVKMVFDPKIGKKTPLFRTVRNPAQSGPAPLVKDPYGSERMIPDPNWGVKREVVKEKKVFNVVVGVKNLDEFTAKIAPLVYNAEKKECLPELPPKVFQELRLHMVEEQARLYARVMREARSEYEGQVIDHKWALAKIQKLHEIASGFLYNNDQEPLFVPTAKFEELRTVLETSLKDSEKAVIFTAFKAEPPMVAEAVRAMSRPIEAFVLPEDGHKRQAEVDRWSAWNMCPAVFIANIASGGVGLNLQAAHTAIFFSLDYKLEGYDQAVDRVHRMGSEIFQKINIIHLITAGTVEEDILTSLQEKRSVVEVFLERLRKEKYA